MKANYYKHILEFKQPSGTSRGVLKTKETWFIILKKDNQTGVGECGILRGLSIDDRPDYEPQLKYTCENIGEGLASLWSKNMEFPSIQIGLEMAFKSLEASHPFQLFPSEFTKGKASIPINGLIWMGTKTFMSKQIKAKIDAGFSCIKMKIGAIDFETEIELLKSIRQEFLPSDIELRVDANGAFTAENALEKLKRLAELQLHSIEQPIKQHQKDAMAHLCAHAPLPIALDEELIGVFSKEKKQELLHYIKPQYIILKPSFVGGFKGTDEWIELAKNQNIDWWITSALESNVGLNAIAQYTHLKQNNKPQGLGTGNLFTNNFDSPLEVKKGALHYSTTKTWDFNLD
ncbi:o-succinylbenzoate synthase [Bizionia saleffrena]|uniref:O-succinylbenzoate synthase n=1 Tax=Bizionia saleffrena TaxID=291189 RepID=A0A8H2LDG2_9FLAO|nr:o-succinylbenzoate synthase [Bizionia saleffrena]TYB73083.1 o-succinylbenzoate synthase [Bizionia saleffrena]